MKIVPPENIDKLHQELRDLGGRVVFTHGIFDLLHPKLIGSLRAARAQGEHLIVGLYSDTSAANVYGKSRPYMMLSERLEVVAALEMVSYVTWFDEDAPESIIAKLQPDRVLNSTEDSSEIDKIVANIIRLPDPSL